MKWSCNNLQWCWKSEHMCLLRRGREYVSELPGNWKPCSKGILYCSLPYKRSSPARLPSHGESFTYITPSDNNVSFFHSMKYVHWEKLSSSYFRGKFILFFLINPELSTKLCVHVWVYLYTHTHFQKSSVHPVQGNHSSAKSNWPS